MSFKINDMVTLHNHLFPTKESLKKRKIGIVVDLSIEDVTRYLARTLYVIKWPDNLVGSYTGDSLELVENPNDLMKEIL